MRPTMSVVVSSLLALSLLLLLPAAAGAEDLPRERWKTGLHLSIAASVACDALDLHSTYHVLDRRSDAAEANFVYGDVQDKAKAITIKAAGSAVLTAAAVKWHDDYPLASLLLLAGNAALKCGFAIRHYRLAREAPARSASVGLVLKLAF